MPDILTAGYLPQRFCHHGRLSGRSCLPNHLKILAIIIGDLLIIDRYSNCIFFPDKDRYFGSVYYGRYIAWDSFRKETLLSNEFLYRIRVSLILSVDRPAAYLAFHLPALILWIKIWQDLPKFFL